MAEGKAKVVADGGLNVRAGAGTGFSRIGWLANGSSISYSAENNGWLQIQYGSQSGYVCKQYTSITSAPTSTNTNTNTNTGNAGSTTSGSTGGSSAQGSVRITADVLNVRTGVGTSHSKIGTLNKGAVVKYYGESGGWYKIDYDGQTGWISGDYATKVSNDAKPTEQNTQTPDTQKTESKTVYVNCDSLNVRTGAGVENSRIGSVNRNQALTVVGSKNGWYQIQYGSGTGWVSADYTTEKKPASGGTTSGGTTSGGNVNVSSSGYARPIRGGTVTSNFGPRGALNLTNGNTSGSYHYGVDISTGGGADILASKSGYASKYWDQGGYGHWIQIDHGDGTYTRYAHMNSTEFSGSQQVSAGQKIGVEGSTGGVTGPHLHFEIRIGGTDKTNAVDPLKYIP